MFVPDLNSLLTKMDNLALKDQNSKVSTYPDDTSSFANTCTFLEECREKNIHTHNDINVLDIVHNKSFGQGVDSSLFTQSLKFINKVIVYPLTGEHTSNRILEMEYGLFYSSNKGNNDKVTNYFKCDTQSMFKKFDEAGISYKLEQTRNDSNVMEYKLVINPSNVVQETEDMAIEPSTSQLQDITCSDSTVNQKDNQEHIKNNPDNIKNVWNEYLEYLKNYSVKQDCSNSTEYLFTNDIILVLDSRITKDIIFYTCNGNKNCVQIKFCISVGESQECIEETKEIVNGEIKEIYTQCLNEGLSFCCTENIINGYEYRYTITIKEYDNN